LLSVLQALHGLLLPRFLLLLLLLLLPAAP
jgi:hypothetical protein